MQPKVKQAIIDANETDTTHIFRTLNNTARVYKYVVIVGAVAPGACD